MANISSTPSTNAVAAPISAAAIYKKTSPEAAPAQSLVEQAKKPTEAALQHAVDQANKVLETKTSNELHFSIDKGTGIAVVKMTNQKSGETIMQFPSEAMMAIARSIDQVTGAILSQKA